MERVVNESIIQHELVDVLISMYEFPWHDRLKFIISKHKDKLPEMFDVYMLYLLTYTIRGRYNRTPEMILKDTVDMFLTYNIQPLSTITLRTFRKNDVISLSDKLGVFYMLQLLKYNDAILDIANQMRLRVNIIHDLEEYKDDSILIDLLSVMKERTDISRITPVAFAHAEDKNKAFVYNIILNILNCCFSDTITNENSPYRPIEFNILIDTV